MASDWVATHASADRHIAPKRTGSEWGEWRLSRCYGNVLCLSLL